MRVPWGRKKHEPGLSSLKKNSSCCCTMRCVRFDVERKGQRVPPGTLPLSTPPPYPANEAMVALGSLLAELHPVLEELVLREGDAVDTQQLLVLGLAEPVRHRVLQIVHAHTHKARSAYECERGAPPRDGAIGRGRRLTL